MMDSDAALLRYDHGPTDLAKQHCGSPKDKCLSHSSLNDEFLYSYDYTTGKSTDKHQFAEVHGRGDTARDIDDENGLSFVRLLKKELSKKKIQENGSMTEEYKDNYFRLVETNQTLAKSVDLIKTKIKQYKHALNNISVEHDQILKAYAKQLEEFKQKIVVEKSKYEDEQRSVLFLRNDIRDVHKKIETYETEIVKTIGARKNAETDGSYKECEMVSINETHDAYKIRLLHVYKELDMARENSKRFNHTKKQFQEKMNFLLNTNEKIKLYFENLLLDNETLKLENRSLGKVLKAHENICLELLRIAADKLDSHNDTKTLNEITAIMKILDENKDRYARQKQKIQIKRQKVPPTTHCYSMKEGHDMKDDDNQEEYHEAMGYHDGNGDGAGFVHLLDELE